jgi:23S rRNA (adenine2030-N6)-methyltransferase
VIDTHAGAGRYDLAAPEAGRTGEYHDGIERVLRLAEPPAELAPYLDVVRALNRDEPSEARVSTDAPSEARVSTDAPSEARVSTDAPGGLRWYPGSPTLARALMRPSDRLFAIELHPIDHAALAATFAGDRQVKVVRLDGYQALVAFVPPRERRALVLVDPPFEERDEFERLAENLVAAHRRFATGIFVIWYPIKDRAPIRRFHDALQASGIRRILLAELSVRGEMDGERLSGCGLVVVNPPFTLGESLARVLPTLQRVLAQAQGGGVRVEWLVPE